MSLKTKNKAENEAEYRNLIEAALYVSGRPLDLKKLSSISGLRSRRILMRLLRQLKEDYAQRQTSIEIVELEDQRYVMQLKPEYTNKVQRLSVRPLLTQGPLKTLSFIAFKQPISQSEVVLMRGKHAYTHIKDLERMGLIECKTSGRQKIIVTTEFFSDYFGLSRNLSVLKEQLRKILLSGEEVT